MPSPMRWRNQGRHCNNFLSRTPTQFTTVPEDTDNDITATAQSGSFSADSQAKKSQPDGWLFCLQ